MAVKPVQVSIDEQLLKRIDADPETRKEGRSAFVRSAVTLYFKAKERAEIDSRIRLAYEGKADQLLDEIDDLLGAQTWPKK